MDTKITATIGQDKYKTLIQNSHQTIIADEHESVGGQSLGFNPHELLASSLAACTCITLRMYADRKHWTLDTIDVQVNISKDKIHESTHFERTITIHGDLNEEQRNRLLEIANVCPIHKTLSKTIYINTLIL